MAARPRAVVIVAILAFAIAVVASVSLYNYLKGQEERVKIAMEEAVATDKVVVAAREIPIGTPIEPALVRTAEWPRTSMPEGAFRSTQEVQGRVAIQTIGKGDPITERKLRPKEGPPGIMTYKIPEGHRAMTVAVDQVSGVAGFITPGSMVDVILTSQPPGYKQKISKIIFQNVPVLATGQIIEQREDKAVIVPTVTLDVTPEDAEKLTMATSTGSLRLLLRRTGDTELASTVGATITKVYFEAEKGKPKKKRVVRRRPSVKRAVKVARRPVMETVSVEVWRNGKKTIETFKVAKEAK